MECASCAIKQLIYQYAHYLDGGDLAAVAGLFSRGKIIAAGGEGDTTIEGAEAVAALYASFTRLYPDDGTPHTLHLTSNIVVDLEDDGAAAGAQSSAVVFQAVDGFPLQPIIGVRYEDRFRKAPGGWYFTERRIDTRLVGDLSKHLLRGV
ncbi:MAG: nuclear transport factor 2 family protein [Pseudomonadales bacterium]|nr:nuclear transport factor 2 family protein [Halieaceae bacterium]MCP5190875.1 nuclear transport factor 2 family protein [Pseudomonadales bacterium]